MRAGQMLPSLIHQIRRHSFLDATTKSCIHIINSDVSRPPSAQCVAAEARWGHYNACYLQASNRLLSHRFLSGQAYLPRNRNWQRSKNQSRHVDRLPFINCRDVDEVLQLATKHIDKLPQNETAAVWSYISRLLSKGKHRGPDNQSALDHVELTRQREQQLYAILQHTMKSLGKMYPRDLTTIVLSMAKIVNNVKVAKSRRRMNAYHQVLGNILIDENSALGDIIFNLCAKVANHTLSNYDARCLSNLAYSFGLLGYNPQLENNSTLMGNIAEKAMNCTELFEPQGYSNTLWAYAKTQVVHPNLFRAFGDAIVDMPDLTAFKPQELANTLWAFATVNIQHTDLFEKIGDYMIQTDNLSSFKPSKELSIILWAYATAGVKHAKLFHLAGDHIDSLEDLNQFNPQALSNIVWSFATIEIQRTCLFEKVGNTIVESKELEWFKSQELSTLVWAFAKAGANNLRLFEHVADHIVTMDNLNSFESQHLSEIVWAFATAKIQHATLFEKVGDCIVGMDDGSFSAQANANIAWSYSAASVQHPQLFKKIGDLIAVSDDLTAYTPQALSNIVWAFASASIQHQGMFKKVGHHIANLKDLESFNHQALANIVWAFATANELSPRVFQEVAIAIAKRNDFDTQALVNIAWSYAVANVDAPLIFNDDFTNSLLARQHEFTIEALRQLYQWHIWQAVEHSRAGLPEVLHKRCHEAFIASDIRVSRLQKNIVSELKAVGVNPEEEYVSKSGYLIDALIKVDGKLVGIEVDGPSHFIGRTLNGRTHIKRRQIKAIDAIPLLSVPYWKWSELGKDRVKKQQYLRSLVGLC